MKKMNKLIAVMTAVAMMGSSSVVAQDDAGVAYYDSYGTTGLAPAIAVGVIAAAAVVAVLVNQSNEGSTHTHYHCNPSN